MIVSPFERNVFEISFNTHYISKNPRTSVLNIISYALNIIKNVRTPLLLSAAKLIDFKKRTKQHKLKEA